MGSASYPLLPPSPREVGSSFGQTAASSRALSRCCHAALPAFGPLCRAARECQAVSQLAAVTKQPGAAASEVHSSVRDLLQRAEALGCDNCRHSQTKTPKNKSQLPVNPWCDSSIRLEGRSGNCVPAAVAGTNQKSSSVLRGGECCRPMEVAWALQPSRPPRSCRGPGLEETLEG